MTVWYWSTIYQRWRLYIIMSRTNNPWIPRLKSSSSWKHEWEPYLLSGTKTRAGRALNVKVLTKWERLWDGAMLEDDKPPNIMGIDVCGGLGTSLSGIRLSSIDSLSRLVKWLLGKWNSRWNPYVTPTWTYPLPRLVNPAGLQCIIQRVHGMVGTW